MASSDIAARAYSVRIASPGEARLAREVMLACWTGSVAPDSSAYREDEAYIANQLRLGGGVFLMLGDEPVGAGRFFPVPGPAGEADWVELKRIGVLAAHRGRALGAMIVSALEDAAQARGYPGAQLGVRADNHRLVAFYAALGYVAAGDVQLSTVNPLTPPPFTMRKRFERQA